MAEARPPKLGRGLAALLGPAPMASNSQTPTASAGHRQRRVPVGDLSANSRNPRKTFTEADLTDLAASIKSRGVLQPIVVRASPSGDADKFEIIAGERRWRAAQRAGVHDVPIVVVEADDRLALELAIIENVQRADLNAAEEARGFRALISEHNYSPADLGAAIGKSRSHVANTLRLLSLPQPVLDMLESGAISAGHARALLSVPEPEAFAKDIVKHGLSVRDVEKAASDEKPPGKAKLNKTTSAPTDANAKALGKKLTESSGLKISVALHGDGGRITIDTKTLEQFDHVYRKLGEL